jgi:uncharacterized protein YkwD
MFKILIFSVLFTAFQSFSHLQGNQSMQAIILRDSLNKRLLLKLINQARQNGCTCAGKYYPPVPEVTWNDLLVRAAQDHSQDMSAKRYFSHIGTDGSDAGTRITTAGYKWINFAENIGMGYKDEEEVIDAWLHSPGHCKNIMNKAYSEIGIANVNGYWTLDLASRQ